MGNFSEKGKKQSDEQRIQELYAILARPTMACQTVVPGWLSWESVQAQLQALPAVFGHDVFAIGLLQFKGTYYRDNRKDQDQKKAVVIVPG